MLTTGQQKYLNSLDDGRVAYILSFDSKCLEAGKEIENKLQEILSNTKVYYIGSSVLEIAGENDIDISVVANEGSFLQDLEIMKTEFGEPKEVKLEREYVKWEFVKNGFQIELYLNGKMSAILEEQIKIHNILLDTPDLKQEYENLKLQFNNKPWKEYMAAKMEFFNKILANTKSVIYLLCGLPGSGKSYWAKQNANNDTISILHDEEFFRKYGDNWDRKKHDELSENLKLELLEKIKIFLKEGKNVILDYGFWKKADRDEYRNRFQDLAEVKLIYFDVPKEVRYHRVLNRDKTNHYDLNQEALETFEKLFEVPEPEEFKTTQ